MPATAIQRRTGGLGAEQTDAQQAVFGKFLAVDIGPVQGDDLGPAPATRGPAQHQAGAVAQTAMAGIAAGQQLLQHRPGDRVGRFPLPRPGGGAAGTAAGLGDQRRLERRGQVLHAVEGAPGGDAAVERGGRRAGQAAAQPGRDQRLGHLAGRAGSRAQVLGMFEQEAQRHRLRFWPGQFLAAGQQLPGGDIGQVALPGPQGVLRSATAPEIGQRLGGGEGRGCNRQLHRAILGHLRDQTQEAR